MRTAHRRRALHSVRLGVSRAEAERLGTREHAAGLESRCVSQGDPGPRPQPDSGLQRSLGLVRQKPQRDRVPALDVAVGDPRLLEYAQRGSAHIR